MLSTRILFFYILREQVKVFVLAGQSNMEGQGVVEIGEEQEEVSRDMLIESPARIPHRLMNESSGLFRFLVVKTPRPTRPTSI